MPIAGDGGAYNWPSAGGRSHGEPPRLSNCRRSPPEARSPQRTGASQGNGLHSLQSRIIPQIKQRRFRKAPLDLNSGPSASDTTIIRPTQFRVTTLRFRLQGLRTKPVAARAGVGRTGRVPRIWTVRSRPFPIGWAKLPRGCSTTELRRQTSRSPHSFTPTAFLTNGVLH